MTGGLRSFLAARGDLVPGLVLRAIVPAATGSTVQATGMIVVDLPVGDTEPSRRLALISGATARGKEALRAQGAAISDVLRLPLPVARLFVRWGRRFGSSRIHLSVTDVTGPADPLWLGRARLLEATPVASLVPLVPLCVAALSYAGQLTLSVNADATITGLDVLADGIGRSFDDLAARARAGERLP